MAKIVLQMGILAAISLIAAVTANLSRSGNSSYYLDWWPEGRYRNALQVKGCPQQGVVPAPPVSPVTPTSTGGASVTPDASGGSDNETAPQQVVTPSQPSSETPADSDDPYPPVYFPAVLDEVSGGATFIDARRSGEYLKGHIPGAYSVPAWESPGEKVNALLESGEIVPAAPAVVYCSSSKDCEDSLIVSNLLTQAGFEVVKIYKGGFPEWEHKLPKLVVKGDAPGEVDYDLLPSADEFPDTSDGAEGGEN